MSSEFVGALKQEVCTRCEARRSRDGEGAFLVITCFLGGAREQYPCVGAPTWIRRERQLLDTTGKNPVVLCQLLLHSSI